ncbi:SMC-Scp complex subunit ScpB [Devosia sp. A369]
MPPNDAVWANVAGGWAFRTRVSYADAIAVSAAVPARTIDLSQNEAVVLVSIAYHQPVTRAGVSKVLGRKVSRDVIGALREKNMITTGPRSPTAGAPFTYLTTKGSLRNSGSTHFGVCLISSGWGTLVCTAVNPVALVSLWPACTGGRS